jgi:hypothetical protein
LPDLGITDTIETKDNIIVEKTLEPVKTSLEKAFSEENISLDATLEKERQYIPFLRGIITKMTIKNLLKEDSRTGDKPINQNLQVPDSQLDPKILAIYEFLLLSDKINNLAERNKKIIIPDNSDEFDRKRNSFRKVSENLFFEVIHNKETSGLGLTPDEKELRASYTNLSEHEKNINELNAKQDKLTHEFNQIIIYKKLELLTEMIPDTLRELGNSSNTPENIQLAQTMKSWQRTYQNIKSGQTLPSNKQIRKNYKDFNRLTDNLLEYYGFKNNGSSRLSVLIKKLKEKKPNDPDLIKISKLQSDISRVNQDYNSVLIKQSMAKREYEEKLDEYSQTSDFSKSFNDLYKKLSPDNSATGVSDSIITDENGSNIPPFRRREEYYKRSQNLAHRYRIPENRLEDLLQKELDKSNNDSDTIKQIQIWMKLNEEQKSKDYEYKKLTQDLVREYRTAEKKLEDRLKQELVSLNSILKKEPDNQVAIRKIQPIQRWMDLFEERKINDELKQLKNTEDQYAKSILDQINMWNRMNQDPSLKDQYTALSQSLSRQYNTSINSLEAKLEKELADLNARFKKELNNHTTNRQIQKIKRWQVLNKKQKIIKEAKYLKIRKDKVAKMLKEKYNIASDIKNGFIPARTLTDVLEKEYKIKIDPDNVNIGIIKNHIAAQNAVLIKRAEEIKTLSSRRDKLIRANDIVKSFEYYIQHKDQMIKIQQDQQDLAKLAEDLKKDVRTISKDQRDSKIENNDIYFNPLIRNIVIGWVNAAEESSSEAEADKVQPEMSKEEKLKIVWNSCLEDFQSAQKKTMDGDFYRIMNRTVSILKQVQEACAKESYSPENGRLISEQFEKNLQTAIEKMNRPPFGIIEGDRITEEKEKQKTVEQENKVA